MKQYECKVVQVCIATSSESTVGENDVTVCRKMAENGWVLKAAFPASLGIVDQIRMYFYREINKE